MPTPAEYLIRRAIRLQHAGRDSEAIAVYREAVAADPQASQAWFNLAMLQDARGSDEAYAAFAQFIRTAPARDPFVEMAAGVLRAAGHEVPDSPRGGGDGDGGEPSTLQFTVTSGGKTGLLITDDDAGVDAEDLLAALSEFIEADTWLDSHLVLTRHPELLSSAAHTLLEFQAGQGDDRRLAHQAAVNLAMLTRVREIGLLAAFAEGDQTPVEEFRGLVRAKLEIEPVLRTFNGLTQTELWRRLDDVPWLARDDDTYVLLARLAESASDEHRAALAHLRLILERHAQGRSTPDADDDDHGPGKDQAGELERIAGATSDTAADEVARFGEQVLARGAALSAYWRVDIARTIAQSYLRYGSATDDLAALARAQDVMADVHDLVVPGTWQDTVVAVTYANSSIRCYEISGDETALQPAIDRLLAARQRVGRYRSSETPILRALGDISTLWAERIGDTGLLREAVELFSAAERISLREGNAWLVNQAGLLKALLQLAEQGDADALSHCEQAVDELMQRFADEPGSRAKVWELAGRVASSRYRWTRGLADLDTAVNCDRTALAFPEVDQADRVHLHNNLAFALWRRYQAAGLTDDLEQARRHAEAALGAIPDRAPMATRIRRTLAHIYTLLGTDRHARAIADLFRLDLRVLPEGPDRTVAALNLALTLLTTAEANPAPGEDLLREADAALTEGARTLDPELMPWEAVEVGTTLGHLLVARGAWLQAASSFAWALQGIEALSAPTGSWWEESSRRLDEIVQWGAYCAGRADRFEQAVIWLETHRTRALRNALRLDTSALTELATAGHNDLARAYATRADELRSVGHSGEGSSHTFRGRRQRMLRDQLAQLAQHIREIPGFERFGLAPDVQDLYRAATPSPLLYVTVTSAGGLALLVNGANRTIDSIELPDIQTQELATRAGAYLAALDTYRADTSREAALRTWLAELDDIRTFLWSTLVRPLAARVPGDHPVTIVSSGLLGLLPITAAESPDGDLSALDVTEWRFAPCAEALLAAHRSAGLAEHTAILAVLDPQPTGFAPLPWAAAEEAALRAQHGALTVLAGPRATAPEVLRAMPNHTVLHFSCHGAAYLDRPLESYLMLARSVKLTVGTLADEAALWGARLCFLSACDSGVAGTSAPQEAIALPNVLMQMGAAGVVASQWPVSDAAAAVLAARFYQAWSSGEQPATAFAQAQRWLRTATRGQISALLRPHIADGADLNGLIAELPLVRVPFAQARDWAAFTYVGC